MKLNERVAIISEENVCRLIHLYGEINIDDLSRIVNNHLEVAIDEIEEDYSKQKKSCCECDCMKIYEHGSKIYYCDHDNRTDDMGKLSVDHPPKTSPEWCPLRKKVNE